ncbi:aldo/keto reductase [Rhizobium sp. BT-175]|uniref:aldo/keto reductase n=1 Tax=Rhizobium sp. BT-175 TaxID=2986929 RepID=UPI00223635B2|nr:aldo/keto reductase [Rhizobium sp. BT-175]MCV9947658.1 aldo/keto reductase [Rhizobium sp. BT-175]
MEYRSLGNTGLNISTISLGTWPFGGSWGRVDEDQAMRILHRAIDLGVNLFDTADVYGDGRSERLLGQLRAARSEPFSVATKVGLRLEPHVADGYTRDNLSAFIDRSLSNLRTDRIDLLQLHSPPTDVYYRPEIFAVLEDFVQEGKVAFWGVSVNRVEEGLKAIEYPIIRSVQIVYNMFRQRPAELLFEKAKQSGVGILARLPLASGLLSGRMNAGTSFAQDDHRSYNRNGEKFDRGETFAGVDFETAVGAVEQLRRLVPSGVTMAQWALRWILMNDAVSCAIPGARRVEQLEENVPASGLAPLNREIMNLIDQTYKGQIRNLVHNCW